MTLLSWKDGKNGKIGKLVFKLLQIFFSVSSRVAIVFVPSLLLRDPIQDDDESDDNNSYQRRQSARRLHAQRDARDAIGTRDNDVIPTVIVEVTDYNARGSRGTRKTDFSHQFAWNLVEKVVIR